MSVTNRPDIVFIITDQQRYDTIGALGFPHADTPVLDRLVNQGTWFSRCYVSGASCVPARASLFTGVYPHTNGILTNASSWRHSWIESLAASGYLCVNVGKMHTQPMDAPAGFHDRTVVENKDRSMAKRGRDFVDAWDRALTAAGLEKPGLPTYRLMPDYRERMGAYTWPLDDAMHPDTFVGRTAEAKVQQYADDPRPLFLQVGFPGPHPPYDPPARLLDRCRGRDMPLRAVQPGDLAAQPTPFRRLREKHVDGNHDATPHTIDAPREWRLRQRAHYSANVTLIDDEIGRLLGALERAGRLRDTIVVFTSDHGDTLGDHGHSQKWTMYEEVVRVPLVVWSPRLQGRGEIAKLVQSIDMAPTLLQLAGLEKPDWWEARSLLPALTGETFGGREAVFCEQGRDVVFQFDDFVSMLRTERWKYVQFHNDPGGQLFDLDADPHEEHDRWADPGYAGKRAQLRDHWLDWRLRSAYDARDWADAFR
ncbi:MAG: sulfatase-like hydrolase/transferase [Betaproteobacteria bacterium]